jgi:2-polyprenyl-6-methoxyphenol hydroxylase-like FAD-dependent oxidoreductase
MPEWKHPTLPLDISEQVWGPGTVFGLFPCNDRFFFYASDVRPEGDFKSPPERKADLLRTFGGWPESITELLEATPEEQIFQGDLYVRPHVTSWSKGPVALIGDAAHPTMPAFGQGGCMAIEDAAVLARELGEVRNLADRSEILAAIERYEGKRIPRTKGMVQKAGIFARMNSWKNTPMVVARDTGIAAIPEAIWLRMYEHEHTYQL